MTAHSGADGLDIAATQSDIGTVVCGVLMPNLDGHAVALGVPRVRAAVVEAIFIGGHDGATDEADAGAAGVFALPRKPLLAAELREVVACAMLAAWRRRRHG